MTPDLKRLAELAELLAEPKRLEILALLVNNPLPVAEIAEALGMSLSNCSQHLAKLEKGGMVSSTQDAQRRPKETCLPALYETIDLLKVTFNIA